MYESRKTVLDTVVSWYHRSQADLASFGIELRLIGPTADRSKDSATVEFISPKCLVAATIWDSGESEVISAFVGNDEDPVVAVQELVDSKAVLALLDRVASGLKADNSDG